MRNKNYGQGNHLEDNGVQEPKTCNGTKVTKTLKVWQNLKFTFEAIFAHAVDLKLLTWHGTWHGKGPKEDMRSNEIPTSVFVLQLRRRRKSYRSSSRKKTGSGKFPWVGRLQELNQIRATSKDWELSVAQVNIGTRSNRKLWKRVWHAV